jgi:hypothetical protein
VAFRLFGGLLALGGRCFALLVDPERDTPASRVPKPN